MREQITVDHKSAKYEAERAVMFGGASATFKHLAAAYLELDARIAESQKQKPSGYRCEWPTSGGDAEDYLAIILIERDSEDGEKDYQVAIHHGFKLEPRFAAPIIPPTPEEAVAQARAEERERLMILVDELSDRREPLSAKSICEAIRERKD